ncbi:MAG TPA: tetratricopeptide repeat protein [Aquabacterium sp.]|nr:tetratricopeptide repeat protein [Aquabacterium sp.]
MPVQSPYSGIPALIIDDMAAQQSTLRSQLSLLGFTKIDVASTPQDAVRLIKSRSYGLILCDFNLNQKTDGQQLFEYLRDNDLLPPDCLFFMITAESSYASVAAATEHHPDAYLLKPTTAGDIEDRLKAQLDKRAALKRITDKLKQDDLLGALDSCDILIEAQNRWFAQAMQLKGQTLLKLSRNEEAKALYQSILEKRPDLIWAQLGLARAYKAIGRYDEAEQQARKIIESPDGAKNVAAYEIVAETLEAQGDPQAAMSVLRDVATIVPSARRQRIAGESAFRNGDLDAAKELLSKAHKASKGSVVAQPQDALLLAQTLVDGNEPGEALRLLQDSALDFKNNPAFGSVALAIQAQAELRSGKTEEAEKTLAKARVTLTKGKADFASLALAKAELMAGHEEEGLNILNSVISSDHENLRIKQLVSNALKTTGHADKIEKVVEGQAAAMEAKVKDARKLLRDSQIDEAVEAIEAAVGAYPENTGVLLQAAQINCMALRLKKEYNADMIERVRLYLTRLEQLMPGHDRVTKMRSYFRETQIELESAAVQH